MSDTYQQQSLLDLTVGNHASYKAGEDNSSSNILQKLLNGKRDQDHENSLFKLSQVHTSSPISKQDFKQFAKFHRGCGLKKQKQKQQQEGEFAQISKQIKQNRDLFKNLNKEESLNLQLRQAQQFIADQYQIMKDYSELQVTRLKKKITKVEEDLIKQQPRLFLSNKDRGARKIPKSDSNDKFSSDQGKKTGVDREIMSSKISSIEIGPVINDFDIQKEMKARLIKKNLIKLSDSDYTLIELHERQEAKKDYKKCKVNIKNSQKQIGNFKPPKLHEDSENNCFLIMGACNEDNAYYQFKRRNVKMNAGDIKPRYYSQNLNVEGSSPTFQERLKKQTRQNRMLDPEELEDLKEQMAKEARLKIEEKQRILLQQQNISIHTKQNIQSGALSSGQFSSLGVARIKTTTDQQRIKIDPKIINIGVRKNISIDDIEHKMNHKIDIEESFLNNNRQIASAMGGKHQKPKYTVGFALNSQSIDQIDENNYQRRTETNHFKSRKRINHSTNVSISPDLVQPLIDQSNRDPLVASKLRINSQASLIDNYSYINERDIKTSLNSRIIRKGSSTTSVGYDWPSQAKTANSTQMIWKPTIPASQIIKHADYYLATRALAGNNSIIDQRSSKNANSTWYKSSSQQSRSKKHHTSQQYDVNSKEDYSVFQSDITFGSRKQTQSTKHIQEKKPDPKIIVSGLDLENMPRMPIQQQQSSKSSSPSKRIHKLTAETQSQLREMVIKCYQGLSDEGERQFDKSLLFEDIRGDRLQDMLGFFDNYNYLSAHQMMIIKALKKEDEENNRRELEEVIIDYKLGTMDPKRTAASFERMGRAKKINLEKKQLFAKIFRNINNK